MKRFLRNAWSNSASVLTLRGRNAEAAWSEAEKLAADPNDGRRQAHGRAVTAALADGRVDDAIAASKLARQPEDQKDGTLYDMGCTCALAASARSANDPVREQLAAEAVECLREAVRKGNKNAEHIRNDADFAALREQEDFQAVLRGLDPAARKE